MLTCSANNSQMPKKGTNTAEREREREKEYIHYFIMAPVYLQYSISEGPSLNMTL